MRMRRGEAMPRHTHGGIELVLMLDGGFTDERGSYRRGDVVISDGAVVHRPVADDDADCLCLVVMEGGLKLTGPLGRILNLFFRY
jgi:putative transcriptional regulator